MISSSTTRILEVWEEMFPLAACELVHQNVFQLLIAVMLSAQTTDKSVNQVTKTLFVTYPNVEAFDQAELKDLEHNLKRIGLFRNKAKSIKETAAILNNKYDGIVPNTRKELMSLPGVGRKTANVVLSVGFGIPAVPVDTHVERIAKRLKFAKVDDSVGKVEEKLKRKLPRSLWNKTHHQMIFFGRYHCTAKNPKCSECKLIEYCRVPKGQFR